MRITLTTADEQRAAMERCNHTQGPGLLYPKRTSPLFGLRRPALGFPGVTHCGIQTTMLRCDFDIPPDKEDDFTAIAPQL